MFDALVSWENLLLAYRRAAAGKRGRADVAAFEHRLEENLLDLRAELESGSYRPAGYRSFFVHDPKRRLISAAPFRDRVVHHALCNLIEPLFERSFTADSFANRRGKGTHRGLRRCQVLARRHSYVLQCDIRQFFPSIDHAVLRRLIQRKVEDSRVLALIDRILASGRGVLSEQYEMVYFPGDDLFAVERSRGLPIGNLTSQFWANVYLSPLDHFVKRELRCPGYVRYVDDLLLFADEKPLLWRFRRELVQRLELFRLMIHAGAHPRPVAEGIPFLGFVTYPNRRRLKRRKGIAYRRRLRHLRALEACGEVDCKAIRASIAGWMGHVGYGNTVGLRKAILDGSECD